MPDRICHKCGEIVPERFTKCLCEDPLDPSEVQYVMANFIASGIYSIDGDAERTLEEVRWLTDDIKRFILELNPPSTHVLLAFSSLVWLIITGLLKQLEDQQPATDEMFAQMEDLIARVQRGKS